MTEASPVRLLLGPQRPTSNLAEAIELGRIPDGPIAVISAGWQEAEGDLAELHALTNRPLVDLALYERAERLFAADPALKEAYRDRQDRLVLLQRLYRLRLKQLAMAARQVLRAEEEEPLVAGEQRHAIAQLRALDRHQLRRTETIQSEFRDSLTDGSRTALTEQTREIRQILDSTRGVLITGGNVLVLLNRIRLFDVDGLLADTPLIGFSAGAMVLADRIVLYHDRAPQGRRDPELLGAGTGIIPRLVVLPDARRRLRGTDRIRIGLYAQRFSPAACVALDSGSYLQFSGTELTGVGDARQLTRGGRLARMRVP